MSEIINTFSKKAKKLNDIEHDLYQQYNVKKGLRNEDGTGVLVGLTKIADVVGYNKVGNKKVDVEGKLYYRGVKVTDFLEQEAGHGFLFEEICFLILFGYLPNEEEFEAFKKDLSNRYALPKDYLESKILNFPSLNLMNKLQQEVLMLYSYDEDPDNVSADALLDKGLDLIAKIPSIVCYAYRSKMHYYNDESLVIHPICSEFSIAENILYLLRNHRKFTEKEVEILDMALVLHADHGGGNNSTFTNVVISSTGTDIYSSFAGAIGSLKGPKHGGANLAVMKQMRLAIQELGLHATKQQLKQLINRILDKEFNDNEGLIYGIGHAVYTLSDPRCKKLCEKCHELSKEKKREEEFLFYKRFEEVAIDAIYERKAIHVCANVDFYSGLIYDMLDIPEDLYTLMFVIGRSVGWLAHTIENKKYSGKIIRPAAKYVGETTPYVTREERKKQLVTSK